MSDILDIEERCFGVGFAWGEEDFIRAYRQRNVIGMTAERDERVVGFMIYGLTRSHLEIVNFAVHPQHWRTGVGRAMVEKLFSKLSPQRRNRLFLFVRESNLDAQKFFAAMGFRATDVSREHYCDTKDDAYRMEFICGESAKPRLKTAKGK